MRLLVRLWIYLVGVKFYRTHTVPIQAEVLRSVFEVVNGEEIEFLFFRESYLDTEYKRGRFNLRPFHSFIIQSKIPATLEVPMIKFSGHFFFFKGEWMQWIDDDVLAGELLKVYLSYINTPVNTT